MFYVILLGLVGATTVVLLQDSKSSEPKQDRIANVMKKLVKKSEKDQFVCTQLDERYAHYVYESGPNAINVLAGPDYITISAQRQKTHQPLLDVRFDTRTRLFTEKTISESLIKNEKDREHIEQFLKWAIVHFQPEKTTKVYLDNDAFTSLIDELEEARKNNRLTSPIDHAFTQIIPGLAYLIEHFEEIADVDYQYQVRETIIRDLRKLLDDFAQLERKQQEKFEHDTLNSLITVQERITQIRRHIDTSREFDLKKTLTTIDERYDQ